MVNNHQYSIHIIRTSKQDTVVEDYDYVGIPSLFFNIIGAMSYDCMFYSWGNH